MIVISEIGNIHRFAHSRQLMAYLGLVPTENSSGGTRKQGSITKAGNGHLRWIMTESAQHYRLPPKVSRELSLRQLEIPEECQRKVKEISWKCQNRLYEKGRKLAARGKMRQKTQTAMARELTSFVWEVMRVATPAAIKTNDSEQVNAVPVNSPPLKPTKKTRTYQLNPK
jgi:hypothetical protein